MRDKGRILFTKGIIDHKKKLSVYDEHASQNVLMPKVNCGGSSPFVRYKVKRPYDRKRL